LALVRAEDDWDERTGIAPLRAAHDCADDAEHEAAVRLARTKPITAARAAAFIQYVCDDDDEMGQFPWHKVALKTVVEALSSMVA
jgi:hypothetical protein